MIPPRKILNTLWQLTVFLKKNQLNIIHKYNINRIQDFFYSIWMGPVEIAIQGRSQILKSFEILKNPEYFR